MFTCIIIVFFTPSYIIGGRDAYFPLQIAFSIFGLIWIYLFSSRVKHISELPADAWRTHLDDEAKSDTSEMMNGELNNGIFKIQGNTNKKAR
jgi:hypothetical protein